MKKKQRKTKIIIINLPKFIGIEAAYHRKKINENKNG
jgi:hypothetical protein